MKWSVRTAGVCSLTISAILVLASGGCDDSGIIPTPSPEAGVDATVDTGTPVVDAAADVVGDAAPDTATLDASNVDVDAGPIELTNSPKASCVTPLYMCPDTGENNDLAVVRLTPPYTPFTVTSVKYELGNPSSGIGDTSLAHDVFLFVANTTTSKTPPATPTIATQFTTSGKPAVAASASVTVTQTLSTPVTIHAGEDLFVGVQVKVNATDAGTKLLCVTMCSEEPGTADRNYYSNGTTAPYPWTTLASFNIQQNMRISATGQ